MEESASYQLKKLFTVQKFASDKGVKAHSAFIGFSNSRNV